MINIHSRHNLASWQVSDALIKKVKVLVKATTFPPHLVFLYFGSSAVNFPAYRGCL